MEILFYSEDSNIFPATTCLDYVNRTINFRENQGNLFLSIQRPHKATTKSTIAIRTYLQLIQHVQPLHQQLKMHEYP